MRPELPSLSAVVPVHNEVRHVEQTLRLLRQALAASPWAGSEVVVVDDGSTDGSAEVLDAYADELGLKVVHQRNSGRLAARFAGLRVATGQMALLVDSRVHVHAGALAHLAEEMAADPSAVLWNGDVTVSTSGNPYAAFWSALTTLGWRRYFRRRRRTSYGPDDFELYPKGTTLFLAPRQWLLQESQTLDTRYDVPSLVSDDTALLRALVRRGRIHLSPGFSCTYHGRTALIPFVRQAYYRGTTFVDGYVGRGGPVGRAAVVALLLLPPSGLAARRFPRAGVGAAVAAPLLLGAGARWSGARPVEAASLVVLSPLFAVFFSAGAARGGVLAAAAGYRRRRVRRP